MCSSDLIRSVLAGTGDVVLAMGVEVQNTLKAIYGADVLAAAGWYQKRKSGHAYFFPGQFSNRAGAYYERFGRDYTRKGLARWFKNAIENALKKGGNDNFQIELFKDANHLFQKTNTGLIDEYALLDKNFVDGFLEFVIAWLQKNTI